MATESRGSGFVRFDYLPTNRAIPLLRRLVGSVVAVDVFGEPGQDADLMYELTTLPLKRQPAAAGRDLRQIQTQRGWLLLEPGPLPEVAPFAMVVQFVGAAPLMVGMQG
jgi:hypothetical protein